MYEKLYTTGEFAKRANVTVRTIRYYDDIGLLKPAIIKDTGYRYYTDNDFVKLQKIIVLKRLGFPLQEISAISCNSTNTSFIQESFDLQLSLIQDKITELKHMEEAIKKVSQSMTGKQEADWSKIISLIHLIGMEDTITAQYKNSANINARIELHKRFSINPLGWFRWIFNNLNIQEGMNILEVGCGNGQLWVDNLDILPPNIQVILSDISSGMLKHTHSKLKSKDDVFSYNCFSFDEIPYANESFDVIIANHVLFYAKDREKALNEIYRVLKKGGLFCCSTYGKEHMKEIETLVKEFDDRIALSEVKLFDIFGLDNGFSELSALFDIVQIHKYKDKLLVTELQPLLNYIYSCHGNQMTYLLPKQNIFEKYVHKKIGKDGIIITKDAGIFCCLK
jgi:DNA-binding transcriptional MerR regulator/phospholipid N-methyltransferase